MKALRGLILAAMLVMIATLTAMPSLAQYPLLKRVYFTVSAPFELKNLNAVLPAGEYTLFQISVENPDVFALYQGKELMSSPVAMVHTTRVDHYTHGYPTKTDMLLNDERENAEALPVIEGWNIPGMNGWEIIGGKVDHDFKDNHNYTAYKNRNSKIYASKPEAKIVSYSY